MPNFARARARGQLPAARHVEPAAEPGGLVELRHRPRSRRPRHLRLRPPRSDDLPADLVGDAAGRGSRPRARASSAGEIPFGGPELREQPQRHALVGRCSTQHGVDTEVYRMPGNYPVPEQPREGALGHGHGRHARRLRHVHAASATNRSSATIRRATSSASPSRTSTSTARPTPCEATLKGPPDLFHLQPGAAARPGRLPDHARHRPARPRDRHRGAEGGRRQVVLLRAGRVVRLGAGRASTRCRSACRRSHGAVRFFAMELRPALRALRLAGEPLGGEARPRSSRAPSDWIGRALRGARPVLHPGHARGDQRAARRRLQRRRLPEAGRARAARLARDARARARTASGRATRRFVYLSDIDLQCHMLWRHADPKYPGLRTRRATRRSPSPTPTTSSATTPTSTRCSGACASGCRRRRC